MDLTKSKSARRSNSSDDSNPSSPREIIFINSYSEDLKYNTGLFCRCPPPGRSADTGQKKNPVIRRMSFQKPRGTTEYSVDSRDTLNSIALKFDTTPNELVQLNKLFSRAVVPGKVLYVPDPAFITSPESSPSLSPTSPLSLTSSDADLDKDPEAAPHHRREATPSPGQPHPQPRPARVVSSTSEEEEALTEKFLKINCKYITDGKGVVSGVLLVTPNNIMFDPHKADPLVQQHGCDEYGIMCPLDELMSAAMCTEVTDARMKEFVPLDLEVPPQPAEPGPMRRVARSNLEEAAAQREGRDGDSASTAPRSTEASLSEDVFTESEISPVRDDPDPDPDPDPASSSDELRRHIRSSGASSESVQTVNQAAGAEIAATAAVAGAAQAPSSDQEPGGGAGHGSSDHRAGQGGLWAGDEEAKSRTTSESQGSDTVAAETQNQNQNQNQTQTQTQTQTQNQNQTPTEAQNQNQNQTPTEAQNQDQNQDQDSQPGLEELRKLWKSHAAQMANEQEEAEQATATEAAPTNQETSEEGAGKGAGPVTPRERRRPRGHKFLCVRVGRPMRKTFVSQASASMQQYAQRDRKKHEYWFAVPPERSDHLYGFFVQWSPDMYGEGVEGAPREPGFVVVKKNRGSETGADEPPVPDITAKDWEITTKEEVNSKHSPSVRADLESDVFRPSLSDPSDLLQTEQIEKLAKHLPPRTIGYPWTLAFSTANHGMSIKSLYRAMQGLDTPVLMVIKDRDGQLFGALASEPFRVSDGFYGTGETFLFTFCPEFEVFKWTGDNMFFLKGDMDSLAFGGGGGEFGLWLDGDLYHGRSNPCKTFGNPHLTQKEDFFLQDIEIWAFE